MFVGRESEMATLNRLYGTGSFEMMVLYGRRRVGKTMLLEKFCSDKPALIFTAQLQSDLDNLRDFSRAVTGFFSLPASTPPFATWLDALTYVAERAETEHFVFVIDEFPYAAKANGALPSALQIAIDKKFLKTSCLMVLCGSNQGFMEQEVLGEKSPLYGRRTAQLKLKPFDYADAALMLPDCSPEEKVSYYAAFGGTPYYLSGLKDRSFEDNVAALFFDQTGLMFDEPNMLMRQELREPAQYTSIMRAIASGATRVSEIADRTRLQASGLPSYLKTLIELDLIERVTPIGEAASGKKSLYYIKDPAFLFWYRFVAPYVTAIEGGMGAQLVERLFGSDRRSEYEGHLFERVCRQWVLRQARKGELPLVPKEVGPWWGSDPVAHERVDIDVVAIDVIDDALLAGECKWRNEFNVDETVKTLRHRVQLLSQYEPRDLYVFSKRRISGAVGKSGGYGNGVSFICAEDMY